MAHTLGTQERILSITTIINVQLTGPIYNYVLVTHSNIYKFWAAAADSAGLLSAINPAELEL